MNVRLLFEIQTAIFRIIFILFGLYLILVLIKEIFLLFFPPKNIINTDTKKLDIPKEQSIEIKDVYKAVVVEQPPQLLIKPKYVKKEDKVVLQTPPSSPSPIKKKVKKRKSRHSKK